ncbi:MAG: proton-conducting transporter membrane subunit [Salinigranum sp.]
MTRQAQWTTVGQLPTAASEETYVPALLTRLVWGLFVLSLGALAVRFWTGARWQVAGLFTVDGLTVVMWTTVTFFGGIVHSYSRRYVAGSRTVDRFFVHAFAFTLAVMVLVAADQLVLFAAAWLAMGLAMARLIGHVRGWPQARVAGAVARRYFLGSSALLSVALLALWWQTGATSISGIATSIGAAPTAVVLIAAGLLLLAAMVQSALFPFHTWLLSSMTAPTPASALMHAGFVNAGAILLVRFAPVVTVDPGFMQVIVVAGAASALLGKLLKTVQTDVKRRLGCSTVGQMGFMIMQAGLGFFGAAVTHLFLHGFYKAYQFLGSGGRIERESPSDAKADTATTPLGVVATAATALAGGVVFAALTGKGARLDSGLLLNLLVVLTTLHAARQTVRRTSLPTTIRYAGAPLVFLPAIVVYAAVYRVVEGLLAGLPAVGTPAELTAVHGVVAVAFLLAYLAVDAGVYRHSRRLYVTLLNWSQPPSATVLTATEEYNEY